MVSLFGKTIEITPPHAHGTIDKLSSAGMPFIKTVGSPIIHGETGAGIQGIGRPTSDNI